MESRAHVAIPQLSVFSQPPADELCAQCASLNLSLDDFIPGGRLVSPGPSSSMGHPSDTPCSSSSWQNPAARTPSVARPAVSLRNFGRISASESSVFLHSATSAPGQSMPRPFASYTGQFLLENLPMIYQKRRSCSFCWLLYMATRAPGLGRPSGYDNLSNLSCAIEWKLDGRFAGAGSTTRRLRVFDPNGQYSDAFIVPLETETSGRDSTQMRPSFLSRRIPKTRVNLNLIERWLDICTRCHGGHCGLTLQQSPTPWDEDWIRNFRFIDTHEQRLVEAKELVPPSNQQKRLQYATLSYCWGQGVEVKLVKQCLPEYRAKLPVDSDRMPRTLRDAMELVRALGLRYIWIDSLCIVQDDPAEWSSVAPLMGKLYGLGYLNICAAAGHNASHGIPGSPATPRHAFQPAAKCFGIDLMVVRPVEGDIHSTAWNTRAWTFQERILSPRSLIFLEQRVYFQCRQVTWSEEINAECEGAVWTLDVVNSPVHSFGSKIPILHFAEYASLYSARKLTVLSDRLVAFNGLAGMLKSSLASDFVFGLPLAYFDWALLWENTSDSDRIDIDVGKFPSWSWCGWNGPAAWRPSMISGTLDNLNAWLAEHTWIKWHAEESAQIQTGLQDMTGPLDVGNNASQKPTPPPPRWAGYGLQWAAGRSARTPDGSFPSSTLPTRSSTVWTNSVLHFWSYTAFFRLASTHQSELTGTELGNGLRRFSIIDNKNDWCGTIVLDRRYQYLVDEKATVEFVAISDAKGFTEEELASWSYYIPEERGLAEWYLYYSLLLMWDSERIVAERTGLGKIYKAAFASASWEPGMEWREIHLR